ncbi:MAG: succinate dehydrogenase, partial [Myxococcales bacterium]
MATDAHLTSPSDSNDLRNRFLRDRLGSILAFFPLGVWTFFHLWDNLAASRGAEAWEQAVTHYSSPYAFFLVSAAVLLPLVWHTLWGIGRMLQARPNNGRYNNFGNFKYIIQRVSA